MPESNNVVMCPLIDRVIEAGDCVVCSDVAAGMLKENCIEKKFRKKDNWRDICKKCEYHAM